MNLLPRIFCLVALTLSLFPALCPGQEAQSKSASALLDALLPGEEEVAEFTQLIGQLGSEQFKVRQLAMEKLLAAPLIPDQVLQRGLKSDEPEVVSRTKEIIKEGGLERSRAAFVEALQLIEKEGSKGLLGKVVEVMESGVSRGDPALLERVARKTAEAGDAELLRRLAGEKNAIYRQMAAAGSEVMEEDGIELLRPLLEDEAPAVRLRAAIGLANLGVVDGARALAEFLSSTQTNERMLAWNGLRSLTRKEFGYSPLDSPEKREAAATKWREWLKGEIEIAGQVGEVNSIRLFNGKDLSGWSHYRRGIPVGPEDATWTVEDGILVCPGQGPGDLRTNATFKDFVLIVSYRATAINADSGIGVMMSPKKNEAPGFDGGDYLEVQLLPGRTGDFYRIGNFKAMAEGNALGFSKRRTVEIEEPLNEWHEARLEVRDGNVKVFVNDILVNEIEGSKEPGNILLREERFRFEFRDITLLPTGN